MTDEKQKQEDDEIAEEQLNDVSGGSTVQRTFEEMSLSKQTDAATPQLMQDVIQGNQLGPVEINVVRTDDDEDD